jgi:hypothetical protein
VREWVGTTDFVDEANSGQSGYAPFKNRSSANMREAADYESGCGDLRGRVPEAIPADILGQIRRRIDEGEDHRG